MKVGDLVTVKRLVRADPFLFDKPTYTDNLAVILENRGRGINYSLFLVMILADGSTIVLPEYRLGEVEPDKK